MAVTVEMETSFVRRATTDATSAAEVLKPGRRLAFVAAETRDAEGVLCAHTTLTYTGARPA